ncbi:MAG: TetR/AcrR family transcriptional regulator [Thermoanaerobaculia bacterium]
MRTPERASRVARRTFPGAADPKDRILRAAAGAIAAHGFHGMSMRELARAAGMSLSNLYNHYPSKEEILFALQEQAFQVLVSSAEDALRRLDAGGAATADARLYVFVFHHVRYVAENPDVMRVLVHEAASLPAGRRREVRALKERYFGIGREIVEQLMVQGCTRLGAPARTGGGTARPGAEPAELDRVTYNLFGMLNWSYGWYDPEVHGPPRELARTIHRIALCGVVSHCPFQDVQESLEQSLAAMDWPPLLGGAAAPDPKGAPA